VNETRDTARQAVVLVSAIVAVVSCLHRIRGSGRHSIQAAAGAALAADATPSPRRPGLRHLDSPSTPGGCSWH
jgi:hypothetical protein